MSDLSRNVTIVASSALSAVLGTIHAFSVFVPQWESMPGADRARVSLIYSVALVSLTVAVLFGYRLYQRMPPFAVFGVVGVFAASGLALSTSDSSLVSLYLTYGLIFGAANGLGYGYALQLAGQAAPAHRGLAMGLVTAFYAVGATAAPLLFVSLIEEGGNALALKVMSGIVLAVSFVAAILIYWSNARYESEATADIQALSPVFKRARILLWISYGSAVMAGLMIIGHAYAIALWRGLDANSAAWATMIVAFGNMLGGFSAGYTADRLSSCVLLRWTPLFTAVSLILLLLPLPFEWMLIFVVMGLAGYCYGAIIALYPVAIVDIFGVLSAPRIYGQVFTAWGIAGLLGPWSSGWLFVQTGTYTAALLIAALFSGVSIVAVRQAMPSSDV